MIPIDSTASIIGLVITSLIVITVLTFIWIDERKKAKKIKKQVEERNAEIQEETYSYRGGTGNTRELE